MADESILTYKRPGFPTTDNSEKSYRTTIEYVGPLTTLAAAEPASNAVWGNYDGRVSSTTLTPLEGTTQATLSVTCEYFYEVESGTAGTAKEVNYEVDWMVFQRSMFEHPVFAIGLGGTYALTSEDIAAIQKWENAPVDLKKVYKYYTDQAETTEETLTSNAQKFAKGLELGQESYEDYAPVVRRSTTYVNGLPATSSAGLKDNPPTFTGGPTGYEWRKTADRATRAGGQTRWERVEEWTGAIKVLSDRSNIYW